MPFRWTEADIFSVLCEAGWDKFPVVAYLTNQVRPWLLKAKAYLPVNGGFAVVEAGNLRSWPCARVLVRPPLPFPPPQ